MPKENSPVFFVKSEVNDSWYKSLHDYEVQRYSQKELVSVKDNKLQHIFSKKSHIKSDAYGVYLISSLIDRSELIKKSFVKNLAKALTDDGHGIWSLGMAGDIVRENISNIENSSDPDSYKDLFETLVKTKALIEKSHNILANSSHINKCEMLEKEFLAADNESLFNLATDAKFSNRFNEVANYIVMECSDSINVKSFQVGRSMFIKRDFIR